MRESFYIVLLRESAVCKGGTVCKTGLGLVGAGMEYGGLDLVERGTGHMYYD